MEIFLTIVAVVVLVASITQTHTNSASAKPENLPSFGEGQDTPQLTQEPFPSSTPKILISNPAPAKTQTPQNQNIDEYIYPGSKIISSSSQNLSLTSLEDPSTITSWYKTKIQSKNLNVNSFVTTQANDKILNKLVGDNGQISITVEIGRESAGVPVTITIGITSR